MNDTIERLACEAGFDAYSSSCLSSLGPDDETAAAGEYPIGRELARFAALVAAECAKIADDDDSDPGSAAVAQIIAGAIRAAFPMPKG